MIESKKPKVSIVIVTWNAEQYLPFVFASLEEQTCKDFNVLVIDNASVDGTVQLIQDKYTPWVKVVEQKTNVGFSRGYNLGIHWSNGEYILIMNQDVVLDPDFLKEAIQFLEKEEKVAAVQGKILQWDVARNRRLDTVDNLGIAMYKNHRFVNRYEGKPAPKKEKNALPVFAFCGSCVVLRRTALESIRYEQEYFDELFFMYKEDIDLSWRLRHQNWDIVYYPPAVAYHGRTLKDTASDKNLQTAAHRVTKKPFLNYISYRNHFYVLLKNEFKKNIWHNFQTIFWYEFRKLGYVLLAETKSLKAFVDLIKNRREVKKRRELIMSKSKLRADDMRAWVE